MDESNTKIYIDRYESKIYKNSKGSLHRLNGPAIEYLDGDNSWYKEGMLHRADGPAIEHSDGNKEWFILYKGLEEKEFNSWILRIKKFI